MFKSISLCSGGGLWKPASAGGVAPALGGIPPGGEAEPGPLLGHPLCLEASGRPISIELPEVILGLLADGGWGEAWCCLKGGGLGNKGGMVAGDLESLSSGLVCTKVLQAVFVGRASLEEDGKTSRSGASSGKIFKGGGSSIGDGEGSGYPLLLGMVWKGAILEGAGGAFGTFLVGFLHVYCDATGPLLWTGSS